MKKLLLWVLLISVTTVMTPNAKAIQGGELALGELRVVALVIGQTNNRSICSGSLLTPIIVVSAAHCLGNKDKIYDSDVYYPENLWIAQPGVDLNTDNINLRKRVIKVILTNGYSNIFNRDTKNFLSQKDDIAFFLLSEPLVENYSVEIASEQEVRYIKNQQLFITHLGYGRQSKDSADGKPYKTQLRSLNRGASRQLNSPAAESSTLSTQDSSNNSLCPGDSGGPWFAEIGGVQKIVAVTQGSNGCGGGEVTGTLGTSIAPYLYLLKEYSDFTTSKKIEENTVQEIQARILNPPRGWAAWINSFEYVTGPNPLQGNKSTKLRIRGVCTDEGKEIQASKNTDAKGNKYPNGMRYVNPKWKCSNGKFVGLIDVTGNTRVDIIELPKSRLGTQIIFKLNLKIVPITIEPPALY